MTLRRAVLWITGRDLLKPKPEPLGNWRLSTFDENWSLSFSGGGNFLIIMESAPNFIHRAIQRVFLGFRWRMK